MGIKEDTFYEGGPHIGDLIVNILLGFTVICLPLTIGSIGGKERKKKEAKGENEEKKNE